MYSMEIFNMEDLMNEMDALFRKCDCIPACYATILTNPQHLLAIQSILPSFRE